MDMVSSMFLWFCYSTLAASAVGLLVIAIQALFHRHMSPRMRHALWLIVLIRLLLPDFPNSPLSLFNAVQYTSHMETEPKLLSQNNEGIQPFQNGNNVPLQTHLPVTEAASPQEPESPVLSSANKYTLALQIVSAIWLAGAVAILLYLLVYMRKLRSKRKTLRIVTDPRILSVMNDCRRKFGIKQPIPLYAGYEMKSPYISGAIAPWIYIPEALGKQLSDDQLYHLFAHELAHYKRKDIAWNLVGSFVLAIHWMNPFIWICIAKMKADRELACDAYALEVLGEDEAILYGMTIIEFLKLYTTSRNRPNLLYFNGSNHRNLVTRRITMIKSFKKGTYKLSTMAVLCVAAMSVMTLTNAAEPTGLSKLVQPVWQNIGESDGDSNPHDSEPAYRGGGLDPIHNDRDKYAEGAADTVQNGNAASSPVLNRDNAVQAAAAEAVKETVAVEEEKAAPVPLPARTVNRLEKAVKDAGFKFKIPNALPEEYRFEQVHLNKKEVDGSKRTEVAMRFVQRQGEAVSGNLEFFAINGGDDLKTVYKNIEQSATKSGEWSVSSNFLRIKEQYAMKVTEAVSGQSEKRYYILEDQGVQYQFQVTGNVTDQEIITIVSSMKQPDANVYKQYGDNVHSTKGNE
ncbi:M56 family metallopeptidase [Paenibacillus sp. N3.4]|uniref:M56 family metallopeptidase n=1 Tax=Paenibacillus sp. N3.4 TaxID=2603222 RepID=UPI0011C960AB|nr:M56 family metallopeptidase [Paenibacillus sp. N3.4]TXK84264.1 M56 family metallopeptidase [Paenibacillus sp. N3.4]